MMSSKPSQAITFDNNFLIAMPTMIDANFIKGVAYVCEHNEKGALAIMVNKPMDITLGEVLTQMDLSCKDPLIGTHPVLYGGPIHPERGFVVHKTQGNWESSFETSAGISVTTSRDILLAIAQGKGPNDTLICLGYAGWDAGQLEAEIMSNVWLNCDATEEILFNTAFDERWAAAGRYIGIDINKLSDDVGHA